jgi:DNA-binding CsgD family transcriptional regulator
MHRVATLAAERRQVWAADLLSPREIEIVTLIERGLSNKQIATRLFIALATVKNHVHSILDKLDVRARGEAAAYLRGQYDPALEPPRGRFRASPQPRPRTASRSVSADSSPDRVQR